MTLVKAAEYTVARSKISMILDWIPPPHHLTCLDSQEPLASDFPTSAGSHPRRYKYTSQKIVIGRLNNKPENAIVTVGTK